MTVTKPKWYPFTPAKGSRQKRPPIKKWVVVKFLCDKGGAVFPAGFALGYRKDGAGDKQSPYFVVPGMGCRFRVIAWCDCLPEYFNERTPPNHLWLISQLD